MIDRLNTPGGHLLILLTVVIGVGVLKVFNIEPDRTLLGALLLALNIRPNQESPKP